MTKTKKRKTVQVVTCPSDFPGRRETTKRRKTNPRSRDDERVNNNSHRPTRRKLLNWQETAQEIRELGATAFCGKDKRQHQRESYKKLTGRDLKQQKVPLPIVRGIQKKARQRQARLQEEAKRSGMVQATKKRNDKHKEKSQTARVHGPAPSVGFMKKGILKVSKP